MSTTGNRSGNTPQMMDNKHIQKDYTKGCGIAQRLRAILRQRYISSMLIGLLLGSVCFTLVSCPDNNSNNSNSSAPVGEVLTARDTSATVSVPVSAPGTLFWVAYVDNTPAPSDAAALITAAGNAVSSEVIASRGMQMVDAAGSVTVIITGLSLNTAYDFYFATRNAAGEASALSAKLDLQTAATDLAPVISNIRATASTDTTATITLHVSEPATLFWVVYTDNATAPASADALIEATGSTLGSPVVASSGMSGQMVTAAGDTTVSISGLIVSTNYDFYVVARDSAMNTSSVSNKLDFASVADTFAPVLSNIRTPTPTTTSATITVNINEASTLFWVAYTDGATAPVSADALIDAVRSTGNSAIIAKSDANGQPVASAGDATISVDGLTPGTNYNVYFFARDGVMNTSALSNVDIRPLAIRLITSGANGIDNNNQIAGRVEIYHNDAWGTVCDDSWSETDAQVACRELGHYTASATAHGSAHFGQGSGSIWLDDPVCVGTEERLMSCPSSSPVSCSDHSEDVGVTCLKTLSDLTVSNTISPAIVAPGYAGSWSTTVTNTGPDATSATTEIRFYESGDSNIPADDSSRKSINIAVLQAGDSQTINSFSIRYPNESIRREYHYGACVSSVLNESNTDNNCSTPIQVTTELSETALMNSSTLVTLDAATGSAIVSGRTTKTGESKYYRIEVTRDSMLTAFTTGNGNTVGVLYGSNGNLIADDDNSGEGSNFRIAHSVTAGTYYVRVRDNAGNVVGPHSLTITVE